MHWSVERISQGEPEGPSARRRSPRSDLPTARRPRSAALHGLARTRPPFSMQGREQLLLYRCMRVKYIKVCERAQPGCGSVALRKQSFPCVTARTGSPRSREMLMQDARLYTFTGPQGRPRESQSGTFASRARTRLEILRQVSFALSRSKSGMSRAGV